jgi:hypothetical protein
MRKKVRETEAGISEQLEAFRRTEFHHRNSYRELKAAADRFAEAVADIDEEELLAGFKQLRRAR